MSKKGKKAPPMQAGVCQAMQALDSQIARRMQRGPAEREEQGVQKWQPYTEKIEEVTTHVLDLLGDDEVQLDSLLVLSQAFSKSLYLLIEELGEEGLGALRSGYCRKALEMINRDVERAQQVLDPGESQLN